LYRQQKASSAVASDWSTLAPIKSCFRPTTTSLLSGCCAWYVKAVTIARQSRDLHGARRGATCFAGDDFGMCLSVWRASAGWKKIEQERKSGAFLLIANDGVVLERKKKVVAEALGDS